MVSILLHSNDVFKQVDYDSERDLEDSIVLVQHQLFGSRRIYLDIKKKVGRRGQIRNIPDGYLIDLSGHRSRLYVVENELESHDPLRHIAVQILQFSLSIESEPRLVRDIIFEALQNNKLYRNQCLEYIKSHNLRNFDHFVDELVFNSPFAALVIIDRMPDDLANILNSKFQFGVEVLELARFENSEGERIYHFEPFLLDAESDVVESNGEKIDLEQLDTVVVPARREGFEREFLQENRWYAIRMHATMRTQIKYIAVYQVSPISAITHIGRVESIQPWKDSGKYSVNLSESADKITPIPLVKGGKVRALQNLRYTTLDRLLDAKTLDDVW